MQTALTTSTVRLTQRDPKGIAFMNKIGAAYDKAGLNDDEGQRVNEAKGLTELVANYIAENRALNLYENEEVSSNYRYPKEYKGPKPVEEQIDKIAEVFGLDGTLAIEYARHLPDFKTFVPEDALPWVGWFAVVSDSGLVKPFPNVAADGNEQAVQYCLGTELAQEKITATRPFHNWHEGQITPEHLRLTARTAEFLAKVAKEQPGDIWLIAAQLGMRHRGRSPRRARAVFAQNEFGLGSVIGGAITLTHPERFARFEELDMDLPGDEFDDPDADVRFGHTPYLYWCDGELEFGTGQCGSASVSYGSASAFLPKFLSIGRGVFMTPFLLQRTPLNESNRRAFSRFRQ